MVFQPSNLTDEVLRAVEALKAEGAREVYLFGSRARGDSRPHSDIDVAVSGLPAARFYAAAASASTRAGRTVDMIDLDSRSPFAEYLRSSGELRRVG